MFTGWLVTLATSLEDVPVRTFDTLAECDEWIEANPPENPRWGGLIHSFDLAHAIRVATCDPGVTVYGYRLVEFKQGKPVSNTDRAWISSGWEQGDTFEDCDK